MTIKVNALSVVLLVIIAMLCSLLDYENSQRHQDNKKAAQTRMQMIFLAASASEAQKRFGEWPASIEQLETQPDGNMAIFLKLGTNDSWGHPIIFEPFSASNGYGRIVSHSANGRQDIILHYGYDQKVLFVKND
jgi:hypothetical protein